MKIAGIPRKNRNLASSRIRFFAIMENLPKDCKYELYHNGTTANVLYVQKLRDKPTLKAVDTMKRRGATIIYDRDDFRENWVYGEMADRVDAITTDTEANAEFVRKHTKTPVFVVPDCIDYGITQKDRILLRKSLSIVTFGKQSNVEAAASYFRGLQYKTAYFAISPIKKLTGSKFIEWNRKTFVSKVKKYDVAFLTHEDTYRTKLKPNTRMVVAMALGMPVISTKSSEFERTLKKLKCDKLLASNQKDMIDALGYIKNLAVKTMVSNLFFDYAWKNYRPEQSAQKLVDVIRSII